MSGDQARSVKRSLAHDSLSFVLFLSPHFHAALLQKTATATRAAMASGTNYPVASARCVVPDKTFRRFLIYTDYGLVQGYWYQNLPKAELSSGFYYNNLILECNEIVCFLLDTSDEYVTLSRKLQPPLQPVLVILIHFGYPAQFWAGFFWARRACATAWGQVPCPA
ncbi:hypothetical protein [Burkholderia territorii]|uniref:hypothetical protein n=1 Tax=Burkholderia territorii TaxID=1503055 RepID=UPI0012D9D53C|nr:hypothetical protein [Burkholderia territorii]